MFPTVAETLGKVCSYRRELCWRQLGLKPHKPYLLHVLWSVWILFEQTLYISLQSPEKTIPEHRLCTFKCESNDDRMDKNSLMYTAVTKLKKTKLCGLSPHANYTDRVAAAGREVSAQTYKIPKHIYWKLNHNVLLCRDHMRSWQV